MLHYMFVYGTLKSGQWRGKCWTIAPLDIRPAWTLGELYDTGPYPALIEGQDCIRGELWSYNHEAMERIRSVLDEIEGTNQVASVNEYDRVPITTYLVNGESLMAEAYFYAMRQNLPNFLRIKPQVHWQDKRLAVWPAGSTWP